MNDRIRAREIRVIDADGNQLGVMPPREALRKAREQNFDLVEISPNAVPPVCRIMDYGKFLYENEKKERAAKKNQTRIVLKEVKFSVNVDEHDYVTKGTTCPVFWLKARSEEHTSELQSLTQLLSRPPPEKKKTE